MEPMLESSGESKRPRRSSGLLFMFEAIVWQPTKSQRASPIHLHNCNHPSTGL